VIAKWLRPSGVTTCSRDRRGNSASLRAGLLTHLPPIYTQRDLTRGIFLADLGRACAKVDAVARAIQPSQMHQLLDLADVVAAVRRRHDRHPMASRPAANVRKRVRPRKTYVRAQRGWLAASREDCGPLEAALSTWKDVTFNYASTDTSDFVPTRASPEEPAMRITQGTFSFLPD